MGDWGQVYWDHSLYELNTCVDLSDINEARSVGT